MPSEATLKIVGAVASQEDFDLLVEAVELSCMDIDGDEPDAARALCAAVASGAPLALREEGPEFAAIDRLERGLRGLGLPYVLGYRAEGTSWVESWRPGQSRTVRMPRGEDGEVCIPLADARRAMASRDPDALTALVEAASAAAGLGQPDGLSADFEPRIEVVPFR